MVDGKVRELIEIQVFPELGIRRERYRVIRTGTIYDVYRDLRTGRFTRKPRYVKITLLVSGEYSEKIKRPGKGTHPFWMEMQITRTTDFNEYMEKRKTKDYTEILEEFYGDIEDEIKEITIDKLMSGFEAKGKRMPAWDERAIDMVESENWDQKLKGFEVETTDVEESYEDVEDWGR